MPCAQTTGRRRLDVATGRELAPVHPGAVLFKDLVEPLGLSPHSERAWRD
jgi:hypothetical protein